MLQQSHWRSTWIVVTKHLPSCAPRDTCAYVRLRGHNKNHRFHYHFEYIPMPQLNRWNSWFDLTTTLSKSWICATCKWQRWWWSLTLSVFRCLVMGGLAPLYSIYIPMTTTRVLFSLKVVMQLCNNTRRRVICDHPAEPAAVRWRRGLPSWTIHDQRDLQYWS